MGAKLIKKRIKSMKMPPEYNKTAFQNEMFLRVYDTNRIKLDLQYPSMGMKNAVKECFVRRGTLKRLNRAASLLPKGYSLVIFDAWRPFLLQQELYDYYAESIIAYYHLESENENLQKEIINKYVLPPIRSHESPPVHTTGGAVDLSLMDDEGNMLDMGTAFDCFGTEAATDYYELHSINDTIRNNRRLLYNVMVSAGFTNLPSEWWHYDYGDRFWGYYTNNPSLYDGRFGLEEIYETSNTDKD